MPSATSPAATSTLRSRSAWPPPTSSPGRTSASYVVVQVVAAIAASATLWLIAINSKGMTRDPLAAGGFAANGYGDHSPGRYALLACLIIEILLTAVFLLVIAGVTGQATPPAASPRWPSA